MNTKHTVGEWVMENPENRKANFVIYTTEKPEGILNVYPGEEAEANAKLITAAPILYKASYNALQAIYAMPKSKQGFYQYLINDLLNAIQKANGTII
jgi:hypothetical protein